MADVFSKRDRSRIMARVLGSGNKATELAMIEIFRAYRIIGWRRQQRVFGKPDFIFPRFRLAIFIDGCFWHGCRWHCRMPQSNGEYWRKKIARNVARDKLVNAKLKQSGWRILRIWAHSLKAPSLVAQRIISELHVPEPTSRIPIQYDERPTE